MHTMLPEKQLGSTVQEGETATRPSGVRDHAYVAIPILFCAVVFLWMVTFGTWRILDSEPFTTFYDAQARSLLHGRWDVPFDDLSFESFIRDEKFYAYFGFIPAIARMPLVVLFPYADGHWSRFSLLIGFAFTLVLAYRLVLELRPVGENRSSTNRARVKLAYSAFIVSAGLGSTLLFLGSRSFTYHEALMWGAAFALASYHQLIQYLKQPGWTRLLLTCAFAFLAFFSRASVGAGPVLALALLACNVAAPRWTGWLNRWASQARRPPFGHAASAAATVALVVAVYVGVNYAKFRTYFDGTPLYMYHQALIDPHRLEGTNGKVLRAGNIRTGAHAYLAPSNIMITRTFPWITLNIPRYTKVYPEARYSVIEPNAAVTVTSPALVLLAVLGLRAFRSPLGESGAGATIPLVGALAGGTLMFAADGLTERYVHDLFPFLVLAGAMGVNAVLGMRFASDRRRLWFVLAPLVAWGVLLNCSCALMYQRFWVWGRPKDRQDQYVRLAAFMDRHVSWKLFGPPPAPTPREPSAATPPASP
jgi:hypothetical protein